MVKLKKGINTQRNLQSQLKPAQAKKRPKFLIEFAKPTQSKKLFFLPFLEFL